MRKSIPHPSSANGTGPEAKWMSTRPSPGPNPALDCGAALVASRPQSPWLPPLLCGSRALGQGPSILLGKLPGAKFLSAIKEENDMNRQSILHTEPLSALCLLPLMSRHSPRVHTVPLPCQGVYYRETGEKAHQLFKLKSCGKMHILTILKLTIKPFV